MRLSVQSTIRVDILFWPLQRTIEYAFQKWGVINKNHSQKVVGIKLAGKGSLIRLALLCKEFSCDLDQLVLITFEEHRDVCELLGIRNVFFIRSQNVFLFFSDCWRCVNEVKWQSPRAIINLERCSYAVSAFSLLLSMISRTKNISFDTGRKLDSAKMTIEPVEKLSFKKLLSACTEVLPRAVEHAPVKKVIAIRKTILVNINASELLFARRYPIQHFVTVLKMLHQEYSSYQLILTGSKSERTYVDTLVNELEGIPVLNKAGEWSLKELSDEMNHASLLITGDSMPVHLAAYLETPVVALWGPTQATHFGYDEIKHVHSLSLQLPCSPCFIHPRSKIAVPCNGRIDCLVNLHPQKIIEVCRQILSEVSEKQDRKHS